MNFLLMKFDRSDKSELKKAVEKAVEVLKKGGLVIHPTDTCYGVAADLFNKKSIENVYKFKGRNYKRPFFIIVRSLIDFRKYGEYYRSVGDIRRVYPNSQFTFITDKKDTIPSFFNPGYGTIGIQIPKIEFSLELLRNYGKPLIGTSANRSRKKECYSIKELLDSIENKYDFPVLILDAGTLPSRPTSNIVDVCNNEIQLIRSGDLRKINV